VAVAKTELNNTVHYTPKPVHPALLSVCVLAKVVFKAKLNNVSAFSKTHVAHKFAWQLSSSTAQPLGLNYPNQTI
jgi:hypothetical protein